MPDAEPKRKWFQFSLRLLILVVVASGLSCGGPSTTSRTSPSFAPPPISFDNNPRKTDDGRLLSQVAVDELLTRIKPLLLGLASLESGQVIGSDPSYIRSIDFDHRQISTAEAVSGSDALRQWFSRKRLTPFKVIPLVTYGNPNHLNPDRKYWPVTMGFGRDRNGEIFPADGGLSLLLFIDTRNNRLVFAYRLLEG